MLKVADDPVVRPVVHRQNITPKRKATKQLSVTLYFDNYGFDPNFFHVPVGTTVKVTNISTKGPMIFEALADQPNQNPALDLGIIGENQTKEFTLSRPGVWQYEANHNPSLRGLIGTAAASDYYQYMAPDAQITAGYIFVRYDDYGFMPNELNVPVGTTVVLKNVTDNSQPGISSFKQLPGEAINPALDIGPLSKQHTKTFQLNTRGKWVLENIDHPYAKALASISVY